MMALQCLKNDSLLRSGLDENTPLNENFPRVIPKIPSKLLYRTDVKKPCEMHWSLVQGYPCTSDSDRLPNATADNHNIYDSAVLPNYPFSGPFTFLSNY